MKKILFVFILVLPVFGNSEIRKGFHWNQVEKWAIQDRGRLKPIHTFAEETLVFVTGKKTCRSKEGNKLSATECLFSWLFRFDLDWDEDEFVRVDYEPLKKILNLEVKKNYFSPKTLRENNDLKKLTREIGAKEQKREKISELEKKILELESKNRVLEAIMSGQAMTFLPNPKGVSEDWIPLSALTENIPLPYSEEEVKKFSEHLKNMMEAFLANDAGGFNSAVELMTPFLRDVLAKGQYPSQNILSIESHYNHLRPFRWSWILYTTAFIFLTMHLVGRGKRLNQIGFIFMGIAFFLHSYGFVIRCILAGRPPVSNMYESVIWVTWGCLLFSFLIYRQYRTSVIPTAASVFAIVGLVLADNLPNILDPGIHPLEPVLRNNMWLTIHVLTITLSYAAFALSLCLGNVVLGNYFYRPDNYKIIQEYSLYMYRAMQIGVVLLAAGTILGGVWADYSWGRFWGWDPKEVWALIALLLYLAVLHGRFTGWLKGFGFVATTVISFLGVLMAWYGVNFVLGVGLHSYGFGSGGMSYIAGYIIVQLIFILAAYMNYKKSETKNRPIFPASK